MAAAGVHANFPTVAARAGMYESFYLRAVAPEEPLGVWIRYTVHKRRGERPRGSLWCTVFDGGQAGPFMHKLSTDALAVPRGGWIAVGAAELGPERAVGACGAARWSLRISTAEPELRHLSRAWMYGTPLPRTKLTSPAPAARFDGTLELPAPPGSPALPSAQPSPASRPAPASQPSTSPSRIVELRGWRGMVGHNWGAAHAERWIWLHGTGFAEDPDAWLDVALGRIRVAGGVTPWIANGALSLDGRRYRLGGLGRGRRAAGGLLVAETPTRCRLSIPGTSGLMVEAHVRAPADAIAGWRYSDPDGGDHDVANCSIAALALTVNRPGVAARTLRTAHGAAYELGMRERDHGIPLAPFRDG
jgi:hypothetical protein